MTWIELVIQMLKVILQIHEFILDQILYDVAKKKRIVARSNTLNLIFTSYIKRLFQINCSFNMFVTRLKLHIH